MKTNYIAIVIFFLSCWIFPVGASPMVSDGSDGPFDPQTSQTIDLKTAAPDGVFNFTTIHIPTNVIITFLANSNNTPVFFAATGNILIEGTIDVSSQDFGERGPGSYLGGAAGSGNMAGADGLGGGGGAGGSAPNGGQGNAGGGGGMATSGSVATSRTGPLPGTGGPIISRPKLNVGVAGGGGAGGGGGSGCVFAGLDLGGGDGGNGGGALQLSTPFNLTISGTLIANGAHGGASYANGLGVIAGPGGGGAGGNMEIFADTLTIASTALIQARGGDGGALDIENPYINSSGADGGKGFLYMSAAHLNINSNAMLADVIAGPPYNLPSRAFKANDIVVLRVQDSSGTLTATSARLFMDEYNTNGSLIQTMAIPTNGANALVVSGSAVAEATLTRAPNGRWVCFSGYNAPVAVTNIANSSSVQYPREIATMDVFGGFSIAAVNTSFFNTLNIRGSISDGTNNFWGIGAASGTSVGGLNYYGFDSAAASIYSLNLRVVNLFNGKIYLSTGAGEGIYEFAGLPKSATTPAKIIDTGSGSPYGFAINPAGNIAYVADDSQSSIGGVQRWTNSAGTWSLVYTLGTGVANTGARGLAVDWAAVNPVIFASTSENNVGNPGNRLVRIVDIGAGSAATTLATTASNGSFRGVAFAPQAIGPQSQIQGLIPEDFNARIYWLGVGGSNYVVQAATNLSVKNPFKDISSPIAVPGQGMTATNYLDPGALTNSSVRFYRIRSN